MRLIDADALKVQIHSRCDVCNDKDTAWCEHCCSVNDWEDYIDNAPTVEQSPVIGEVISFVERDSRPKGKWIGDTDYESFQGSYEAYKCSNCGYSLHWRDYYADEYIFCPNCGARMESDV